MVSCQKRRVRMGEVIGQRPSIVSSFHACEFMRHVNQSNVTNRCLEIVLRLCDTAGSLFSTSHISIPV